MKKLPLSSALLGCMLPVSAFADVNTVQEGRLADVTVTANRRSLRSDSYTVPTMSTATGLPISPKDTPQSVSVITRMIRVRPRWKRR